MKKEQKDLLKKIVSLHIASFQLQMKDRWAREDYILDSQMSKEIEELENDYVYKYGNMPEMKNIEDIYKINEELKEE